MFTAEQIMQAHSKVKSGADFPAYIQDLKQLGVTGYTTFVADGHTGYHGADNYKISTAAKYECLAIATIADKARFVSRLKMHQQGQTDYLTFCNDCARSGIERWEVRMNEMTCIYYDTSGNKILAEQIPQ